MQRCVKQVSPLGVCMLSIFVFICSCIQMCLRGQGRVTQISVVCLLTQLH